MNCRLNRPNHMLGSYKNYMKLKLAILFIVLSTQLHSQHVDSLFIGKWVYTLKRSSPPYDSAVDVWSFFRHSYKDTLYHVFPDGSKSISGIAIGIWYVKEDTLFTMSTSLLNGNGKGIHSNKTGYQGTRIIKIDTSIFIIDTPAGNYTYIKQK
jgi:hypothetical protein